MGRPSGTQRDDQKRAVRSLIARHSLGCEWHQVTFLYGPPDVETGVFPLLYAADPYSVILYALHHGIIPPEVWGEDKQLDSRLFNIPSFEFYEAKRRETLAKINPRLRLLMETLYANRPTHAPVRRGRTRSRYRERLRERPDQFRDNR